MGCLIRAERVLEVHEADLAVADPVKAPAPCLTRRLISKAVVRQAVHQAVRHRLRVPTTYISDMRYVHVHGW